MRRLYPVLNIFKGTPTRPTTIKRFDTTYTALLLFIQLLGKALGTSFLSLLQLLYNRIVSSAFSITDGVDAIDVNRLLTGLKASRQWYINVIRSGRAFADLQMKGAGHALVFGGRSIDDVSVLVRIAEFRASLMAEKSPNTSAILLMDRVVLALLSLDRVISQNTEPNFKTITDPATVLKDPKSNFLPNMADHLNALGITPESFKKEFLRRVKAHNHKIINSAGPNGPATWTAHSDARALLANSKLYASFKVLAEQWKMTWLLQDMLGVVSLPSYDSANDMLLHSGRLHDFEEWGGKRRIVAIVDYWTQTLLTPLHDTIFHFLGKIEADGTFNQDAACERVRNFTSIPGLVVNSFDLTAATDRLPLWFQIEILDFLLPGGTASHWGNLLAGREYFHRDTNKGYTYACGQPMGAKSSWAMLALAHHVLVQASAPASAKGSYMEYALLGDDITLTGADTATNYTILMESLGVPINASKSILHFGDVTPAAEFCKRVYINGIEYTTFPVKLMAKTMMNGRLLPQLQNELYRRGLAETSSEVFAWFAALADVQSSTFLGILNALPRSLTKLHTRITVGNKFTAFSNWFGNSYILTSKDLANAYLYVAITEQFKRLDTLLRQSQVIAGAIESATFGYSAIDPNILGWSYEHPEYLKENLLKGLPKLTPTHPIVKASVLEMDRLAALLADLRSGDAKLTAKAERRLLDMFRNSLLDVWPDKMEAYAQAERSLLERSLTLIADLILNRTTVSKAGLPARTVEYTVNLSFINRLWTVSWTLGGDIMINAIRTRIIGDAPTAISLSNTINDSFAPTAMFHVKPRDGSAKAANSPRKLLERAAAAKSSSGSSSSTPLVTSPLATNPAKD